MRPGPLPLTLFVLLATAIGGAAQSGVVQTEVELFLEDPGPTLKVLENRVLTVTVNYRYAQGGYSPQATPIRLDVMEVPAWAAATIEPEVVYVRTPAQAAPSGTTVQANAVLNITVNATGKAFEPGTFAIRATASQNGQLAASEGTASRETSPDFYSVINLTALRAHVVASGGKATPVPLRIVNLGNAPTEIEFILVHQPEFSVTTLPGRLVLPGPLDGGENEAEVVAHVRAPWNINDDGPLEIQVRSSHETKPNLEGDEPTVVIDMDGRALTPGAGARLATLTLLMTAIALRRRAPR